MGRIIFKVIKILTPNPHEYNITSRLTLTTSYSGGNSGGLPYERINLQPGDIPNIKFKIKFNDPGDFNPA